MTHIELISLMNRHKKVIDRAYKGEMPSGIDTALFEAEIFNKIGDRVVLNEAYIQFINTMLKRVEYGVIFGKYAEELQQLVTYKKRFLETSDKTYLNRIRKGIEDVYLKFKRRDSDISVLISRIVHENALSLEVILDDAEHILLQMQELSNASTQTYNIFSKEIVGLSKEIDDLIIDVKIDIQRYSDNLHKYIHRLNGFILRTKQRKEQNNKIAALAGKIMADDASELEALLRSGHETLHHTFGNIKRHKIKTVPSQKDIEQERFAVILRQVFTLEPHKVVKAPQTIYKKQELEEKIVLNYQKLLEDIQSDMPKDLFDFILNHEEIEKFDAVQTKRSEAFKAFLMTVSEHREHTKIDVGFGSHHIRRVAWI
ncbi:hypothetical protein YH65_04130 [Sulfurovum lithotrophicum]|uniref:Uncharacterized protein n=1 Tax=Sulfurovum lithotrophicum TaxID=206403 RepID=A0A7U4M0N5_9BACT|nr:hypothetical protein [Sulfurovum lithotrophicum]AKF24662.1 hypothetical protein YH65_04130 [Sulfurovum lithotrophicum]